ncbi:MAG: hypothetical protein QM778_36405 [Myxococcales bacterium]
MLRSRVLALPLLCAWLTACSFIVDFDRSKIDHGGNDSGAGDGDGDGDGDMDSGQIHVDAGHDASVKPDANTGCTDNDGCASDQLCCGNVCVNTSLAGCTGCGVACESNLSSSCVGRECKCGTNAVCTGSGSSAFCAGAVGEQSCVECRDSDDCPVDKSQCVSGACQACVPGPANAGCGGNKPFCNPDTKVCEACTASPDNCTGALVCTLSGACGGCANSMVDCTNPDEPICNKNSTQCTACTGDDVASSACVTEQGKAYCVNNQKCSVCLPDTEAGCDGTSNKPDCRLNGNQYECQACTSNTHCENLGVRDTCVTSGAGSGKCVECQANADCTDADKPLCDPSSGLCKRCDQVANADAQCGMKNGSTCDEAMGRCVECTVATQAADCTTNGQTVCSNNMCVQCTDATEVAKCGNDVCVSNACVNCTLDLQCVAHTGKQCVTVGAGNNDCKACDPAGATGSNGCTGLQVCNPVTFTCDTVQCLANTDCTADPNKPLCDNTHNCVRCDTLGDAEADAACAGKPGSNDICVRATGACAVCEPATDQGCPGSQSAEKDQCNGAATPACVDCDASGGCAAANTICDVAKLVCVSTVCTTLGLSGDCAGNPAGEACVDPDASGSGFECRKCDPTLGGGMGTAAGCAAGETCQADFTCAP